MRMWSTPSVSRLGRSFPQRQRRQPHRDRLLPAQIQLLQELPFQNPGQLVQPLRLAPEEALQILHPLDMRDDHAARIAENIIDQENLAPLLKDRIRLRRGRPFRALRENAALHFRRVPPGDLPLEPRRHEYLARQGQ